MFPTYFPGQRVRHTGLHLWATVTAVPADQTGGQFTLALPDGGSVQAPVDALWPAPVRLPGHVSQL